MSQGVLSDPHDRGICLHICKKTMVAIMPMASPQHRLSSALRAAGETPCLCPCVLTWVSLPLG